MHQSLAYERWHKRPCKCGTGQRRGCSEHFLYLYYWVAVHPAKRDAQPEFRHIEIASRYSSSHMGVSLNGGTPKTPQMLIILGRKAHGCWGFPHHFRKPPYGAKPNNLLFHRLRSLRWAPTLSILKLSSRKARPCHGGKVSLL